MKLEKKFQNLKSKYYPGYQGQYSLKSKHSYQNKLQSLRPLTLNFHNTTDSKPKAAGRTSGAQGK